MTRPVPLVAAFAAILLAHSTALAQRPIAPAPHISLDELVKEYQRLGLPVPPPEAELVRIEWFNSDETPYVLGFRYSTPKSGTRYMVGHSGLAFVSPKRVSCVTPDPDAMRQVDVQKRNWLCLSAQCKIRGWNDLARALYATRAPQPVPALLNEPHELSVTQELARIAWAYWEQKLTERASDRKEIWNRLKALADEGPDLLTAEDWFTLDRLKLTVAPRTSKPNAPEALIDDLTNHWDDPEDLDNETGHAAYHKLVELGFDAVPALIEHLEDVRLTRVAARKTVLDTQVSFVQVGDLVSGLLDALSDRALTDDGAWWFHGVFANPGAARKWWVKAKRVGEERWVLDHVLREKDFEDGPAIVNQALLQVLKAKYPDRLPSLYQTVLQKRPKVDSASLVAALASSKLPQERKGTLLSAGAVHKEYPHRFHALGALFEVDRAAFHKHLLKTIEDLPNGIGDPEKFPSEFAVVVLVCRTNDRKCWGALVAATRRTSADNRLEFIRRISSEERGQKKQGQQECVRYLLSFLDDTSVAMLERQQVTVRDAAMAQLIDALGRSDAIELPQSPRERSRVRSHVRELAERELARPTK
ncbi:unnamed protein product [Gemmata massiliana]|uniref:Secreted protein n=1 Tax=Gemmata massiliana TaxID=1210884 RepID=A0A6P2CT24_9BACT|nr:hypothetical protein [Gemmata massiliana]VTR92089.1 unnamed protein product [Gemmata massiliana]